MQGDPDGAIHAYEHALRHNAYSIQALNAISCILRTKENFPRAVEYLHTILKIDANNGEVWGSLGIYRRHVLFMLLRFPRALLFDDGRLATSICGIPASLVSPTRSKGASSVLTLKPPLIGCRNQSFGMGLAFSTIVTARLSTPRKPFRKSCSIYKQQQKYAQSLEVSASLDR